MTVTADPAASTRTTTTPPIPPPRRRLRWRSPADQPVWARPALLALAVLASSIYAAGIRDGLVHSYYAPAVKSMSESWRAFFYAGYDPAASITLVAVAATVAWGCYLSRQFSTFLPWLPPLLLALGASAWRCWSRCHWHAGEIGGFEP